MALAHQETLGNPEVEPVLETNRNFQSHGQKVWECHKPLPVCKTFANVQVVCCVAARSVHSVLVKLVIEVCDMPPPPPPILAKYQFPMCHLKDVKTLVMEILECFHQACCVGTLFSTNL